jgi:hypothetical protein
MFLSISHTSKGTRTKNGTAEPGVGFAGCLLKFPGSLNQNKNVARLPPEVTVLVLGSKLPVNLICRVLNAMAPLFVPFLNCPSFA